MDFIIIYNMIMVFHYFPFHTLFILSIQALHHLHNLSTLGVVWEIQVMNSLQVNQ